ncbi:hydroxyacid dehydrogenase [Saliphagus sp. LR7]|uniref:hydroxyacid dehydrogenase n=1 Tax=Saliphagus sp. LR7 TaxID=2282654 RepID=UPI00130044C9|nr:hydroxyacid dehydrogenase [Saliphagus sp. LR7]
MEVLVTIPDTDLRASFFPPERRERLESFGTVKWNPKPEQFTPEELQDRLTGADVCVTGWGTTKLDGSVISEADSLELVTHIGGSVASIGSHALYDAGVTVCSANAVMAEYVAEGILGFVLASLREIASFDATLKEGGWKDGSRRPESLFNATVGFVGLGAVGRTLLKLLDPFDVDVLLYDPYVSDREVTEFDAVERTDLEDVLGAADVTSIHAPKTRETLHMLDAERLACMPDGATLINAARGAIVDQDALIDELRRGRLSAVIDVYEEEPLPKDSPLRSFENVILSPHVAGHPSRYRMPDTILDEIERFSEGQPLEHSISRDRFEGMTNDQLTTRDGA